MNIMFILMCSSNTVYYCLYSNSLYTEICNVDTLDDHRLKINEKHCLTKKKKGFGLNFFH